jgi:hypothetical protein
MTNRLHSLLRILALTAALVALGAPACWAQIGGPAITGNGIPGMNGQGVGPVVNPATAEEAARNKNTRQAPPPALPGAKSDPSKVAAPTKLPTDMNPTDALFDAINRGDITVARDAINRGADLDGHNVLGMTPMELSIDLSRNDISFLLLSMRGGGDSGASAPKQNAKAGASAKPVREVRMKVTAPVKATAPPPPRVARLFSGDGGTPVPASGFLGFDSSGRN